MDVLEEALELFKYCLDFYEEWRIAQRKLKKEKEKEQDVEVEGEYTSLERELFFHTLQRHVEIAKKFMLDLYADFDLYVIDKNRNPFVVIRPGKKSKKIRFGSKRYAVEVNVEPDEVFTLFDRLARESFSKKELEMLNKLYKGTINICRLQDFMDDVKNDPPSELGEEVVVEMEAADGRIVRGVLTYSPHATLGKELDDHLEAINTCKNLSGIEMHFINEVEFGLKIIVAKLKRMKSPYITAIQNVVKISEAPVMVPTPKETPVEVAYSEKGNRPKVTVEVPTEEFEQEGVGDTGEQYERGAGDAAPTVGKDRERREEKEASEILDYPFSEHPESYETDEVQYPPKPTAEAVGIPGPKVPPISNNFPSRFNCRIQ